jgi:hypothetical protein
MHLLKDIATKPWVYESRRQIIISCLLFVQWKTRKMVESKNICGCDLSLYCLHLRAFYLSLSLFLPLLSPLTCNVIGTFEKAMGQIGGLSFLCGSLKVQSRKSRFGKLPQAHGASSGHAQNVASNEGYGIIHARNQSSRHQALCDWSCHYVYRHALCVLFQH